MAFLNELLGVSVLLLRIYFYLMIGSILLSWTSLRSTKGYELLTKITDPYLDLFRGKLITGGWDFGPMLGLFLFEGILYFLESVVV